MKLGILLCDHVSANLAKQHGQYPAMIENLLRPVESNIEFSVFDLTQGEMPQNIHCVDAYITSGSRYGVYEDYPWIHQFESLVQTLHQAQKKLIGICFGHQMIAQALGGKVIKSSKGLRVGMSQNKIYQQKQWMKPYQDSLNILVSHQDQVIELPKEAEVLAGCDFCPNYMIQVGTHFLGIQGHPEFTKAYCRDLLITREDLVSKEDYDKAMKSFKLHEDDKLFAQWITHFLHNPPN